MKKEDSAKSFSDFSNSDSEWEMQKSGDSKQSIRDDNDVMQPISNEVKGVDTGDRWYEVSCSYLRVYVIFTGNLRHNDRPVDYRGNKGDLKSFQAYSKFPNA